MKIQIHYTTVQTVEVDLDDITERLQYDNVKSGRPFAESEIVGMINDDVDEFVTENPWPSYRIDRTALDKAVALVRAKLVKP